MVALGKGNENSKRTPVYEDDNRQNDFGQLPFLKELRNLRSGKAVKKLEEEAGIIEEGEDGKDHLGTTSIIVILVIVGILVLALVIRIIWGCYQNHKEAKAV